MAGRVARGRRLRFIKFHFITNEPLMLDIDDLTAVQYDLRSIYAGRPLLLLAIKIKCIGPSSF